MFDLEIPPADAARRLPARHTDPPPLWLRVLVLATLLWLATRITENVTSALVGMVHGDPAAPRQSQKAHLRRAAGAG